jgi:hypothetical protein
MDVGKSTLTTALVEAGFHYLSDEAAPVDPVTTRVYPFPKRISLDASALGFFRGLEDRLQDRQGLSSQLPQRYVAPEDLGGEVGGPAPAGWVVFLSAQRDGPARLVPVTRAEALQQLVRYTFNLEDYGERGMVLLSRLLADAQAYRLQGGDPRARASLLGEALS